MRHRQDGNEYAHEFGSATVCLRARATTYNRGPWYRKGSRPGMIRPGARCAGSWERGAGLRGRPEVNRSVEKAGGGRTEITRKARKIAAGHFRSFEYVHPALRESEPV